MKVGISNIAWKNEEEASVADYLHHVGIEGIDIAYTKYWPSPFQASDQAVADYRTFWANHGITIVGMQSLIYGRPDLRLFGSPEVRAEMAEYMCAVLRLASKLGVRVLVFGSPQNRLRGELSTDEAMSTAAEFFSTLAHTAAQENVVLCIEPNPPEYNCDFVCTAAQGVELIERVNHPNFRLHLDAAVMTMNNEDVETAVELAAPYLTHFHASEPQLGVVGEGMVNHRRFAAALKRIGYHGWVAVEMRSGWKASSLEAVKVALNTTIEAYS
jgi:sugar phosphate isomerase/epimerase